MATAKTIKKKQSIIIETKSVPTKSLQPYHRNPRIGNIDEIAKSLHVNGQYRPIIVNIGSKTGRKNEILAGNHTFKGAVKPLKWSSRVKGKVKNYDKPAWTEIEASFVDVDDDAAKKIVAADNKTAELGGYDESLLAELLVSLDGDYQGTGFSELDVNELLKDIDTSVDTANGGRSLDDLMADMPDGTDFGQQKKTAREEYLDNEDEEDKEAAVRRGASRSDDDDEDFHDVQAELQGVLMLREDAHFPGDNAWGIPDLRTDMLMDKLPDDLQTWGGWQATPDDGQKWFLYNYSLGGTKGLPYDRTILCFYTFDHKFLGWWETPAYFVSKLMNAGVKYAVVPDFSFYYSEPRVSHLWSVYKAQWLGRFFQEAGVKVIPRLQFDYQDLKSLDIALLGIPRGLPVLATSQQNVEDEKKNKKNIQAHLRDALTELKPKQLLYYAGPPGRRCMEEIEDEFQIEVKYLLNYAGVRRDIAFGKKDGMAAKKARARKKILSKAEAEIEARAVDRRTEDELVDDELGEWDDEDE